MQSIWGLSSVASGMSSAAFGGHVFASASGGAALNVAAGVGNQQAKYYRHKPLRPCRVRSSEESYILQHVDIDAARAMVAAVEDAFARADIARILDGFTEDVIIRFGDLPEMRGRAEAERFIRARFARQKNYRLRKTFRTLSGDTLANTWDGEWEDAQTGKAMRGRGVELWVVRDGRIAVWDCAFNVSEVGGPSSIPIV